MRKSLYLAGAAVLLLAHQTPGIAQDQQSQQNQQNQQIPQTGGPSPAQVGPDPSMAPLGGPPAPVLNQPQPAGKPEGTVGLAPADQPVNNANPYAGGQIVPSSQATAAHDESILRHDHQPTLAHSFNFTADQKRAVVDALKQDKSESIPPNVTVQESVVLPTSVQAKPLPDALVQQIPWLKPYLYVNDGHRIILVDPNLRYVAAIIE